VDRKTDITRREKGELTRREEAHRVPAVDICETPDSLVLLADMPGVGEDGVEVSLEENTLSIIGRVATRMPEGAAEIHTEFEPQTFQRAFTLSNDVDLNAIEGKIKDGVLRLTLPKAPEAQVKTIPIESE